MATWSGVTFDFAGKTALVTGGSGGIGSAIARGFRDAGAKVTITGTQNTADGYTDDLSGMNYVRLNVRDGDAVAALGTEIPRLDALVNAAGALMPGGRSEYDPEAFAATVDINLNGSFRCAKAFLPGLEAAGGAIVNIASMTSYFGHPIVPGYGSSKGGVVAMTRSLAVAWATRGVRVNAVAPGWIPTRLTSGAYGDAERNAAIVARTPMGRWAEADEMAGAALFLCSDAAGFITGATLPVDGGYSAS